MSHFRLVPMHGSQGASAETIGLICDKNLLLENLGIQEYTCRTSRRVSTDLG